LTGTQNTAQFGWSVATAGDVNVLVTPEGAAGSRVLVTAERVAAAAPDPATPVDVLEAGIGAVADSVDGSSVEAKRERRRQRRQSRPHGRPR